MYLKVKVLSCPALLHRSCQRNSIPYPGVALRLVPRPLSSDVCVPVASHLGRIESLASWNVVDAAKQFPHVDAAVPRVQAGYAVLIVRERQHTLEGDREVHHPLGDVGYGGVAEDPRLRVVEELCLDTLEGHDARGLGRQLGRQCHPEDFPDLLGQPVDVHQV